VYARNNNVLLIHLYCDESIQFSGSQNEIHPLLHINPMLTCLLVQLLVVKKVYNDTIYNMI